MRGRFRVLCNDAGTPTAAAAAAAAAAARRPGGRESSSRSTTSTTTAANRNRIGNGFRSRVGSRRARCRDRVRLGAYVIQNDKDPLPSGIEEVVLWSDANLSSTLGKVVRTRSGPGGSGWARTYVLELKNGGRLFAKLAKGRDKETMFRGEFEGLNAMAATETIGVPRAFHYDDLFGREAGSWILMEHVDMSSSLDQRVLGTLLGEMHLAEPLQEEAKAKANTKEEGSRSVQGRFGFCVDNTIGATPQPNDWTDDWVTFYREKRLWHQLQLTGDTKLLRLGEKALERMEEIFDPVKGKVRPSILHGDLWSGNIAADGSKKGKGRPVIFDPACYYGHHEAEFGMKWCASFGDGFWGAYHDVVPKEPGFDERQQMYMLYHYLNHFNLFGSSYYYSCENILKRFN